MYDMIESLIGHTWESQYSGDQQYIYSICCVIIIITMVALVRWVDKIFFR